MTKKQRENMEKNQRTLGKQHMDKIRTAKKKKKGKIKRNETNSAVENFSEMQNSLQDFNKRQKEKELEDRTIEIT